MKRLLAVGAIRNGNLLVTVSEAYLVATGYHFPTPLLLLWHPICEAWKSPLSATSRN